MRTLLRQLGTRQRVSLGLIVLVVLIVAVAKLLPHKDPDSLGRSTTTPTTSIPTTPATGTESLSASLPDDQPTPTPSAPILMSPVPPVTVKGSDKPQVVALSFTHAWLDTGVGAAAWLHALTKYSTPALTTQLADADPANVPANRTAGAVTIVADTATSCDVHVPTDTGTLVLEMLRVSGTWLVDDVDWDRA
jgi:hypothetical protein